MRRFKRLLIITPAALLLLLVAAGTAWAAPGDPPVTFPWGNRQWIWFVAQLHLDLAAFILGAPIFIVISEIIGWWRNDARFERLAHEMTRVTVMVYSLTALFGGFFIFLLIGMYPRVTSFVVDLFFPIWMLLYPVGFILETALIYTYNYTWDSWQGPKKGWHIALGVLLNIVGTLIMFAQNAVASFMLTPVRDYQNASLWQLINNPTWWPLNIHRFIANITFGGFICGMVAAIMFLLAKRREERAFYDWMGFIGNFIGLFTFAMLALPGYIFGKEIYAYDASLGIYMMSDRLSMYFEMQGILIGTSYLVGAYYIWLSMKRITGAERFAPFMKAGFALILIANAIWITPRHWFATMNPPATVQDPDLFIRLRELPAHLGFLALMPAKNTAAFASILVVALAYVFYFRAIRSGEMTWGEINPASQYALIYLAFAAIWTMGLMGAVRELARKYYHVYLVMPDLTKEAYTPTLGFASLMITLITLVFFGLIGLSIWLGLRTHRAEPEAPEAKEAPVPTTGGSYA